MIVLVDIDVHLQIQALHHANDEQLLAGGFIDGYGCISHLDFFFVVQLFNGALQGLH